MTTRKIIEIVALFVLCAASLRGWFWMGSGFTPMKKFGLVLAIVVFVSVSLLILHGT